MKKSYIPNTVFLFITFLFFGLSQVQAQTYRILPLGNSITVGWDGSIPAIDDAISFRGVLQDTLTDEGYDFDFVGHLQAGGNILVDPDHGAISGTTGQNVVRLLQDGYDVLNDVEITGGLPYLDMYPADIILLHIGTNDISALEIPSADDVEDILDEIDAWEVSSGTHVTVFVSRIINRTDFPFLSTNTTTYNDLVETMITDRGDPSVFMIDMENGAQINYATEMMPDGIHPLQAAYDSMGNTAFTVMNDYMSLLPEMPGSFQVGGETSSSIELRWADLSTTETGFEIERSLTGVAGEFSYVTTRNPNSTSFTDTGLDDDTQYYYRIRAINNTGPSFYTDIETTSTLLAIPLAPDALAVAGFDATSVQLSWNDNSDNETGFEIERSTSPSPASYVRIHTTGAGVESYNNTGLDETTTYYYRIRAINAAGESTYSNVVSVTTALGMPAAPTGLTAGTLTTSSIAMSWTDVATNEANYIVQRSTNGSSYSNYRTLAANVTSFTDTGLPDNTTYYYRVYARNATGRSSNSNAINASTLLAAPDDPTMLIITGVNTSSVTMIWNDQSDSEVGFLIERSTESGTGFSSIGSTGPNIETFTNTGLSDNTTYYFRIRAYNGAGFSGYTDEASATTQLSAPMPPSSLDVDNITEASMRLNWLDNSTNETGFEVERSLTAGSGFVRITTVPADVTTFNNIGLDQHTTYYYRVRAVNASGQSAYSNVISGTTLLLLPDAPSNIAFTLVTENSMTISWQDNSNNEENFEIQRSLTAGIGFVEIGTPADSEFDDSGLDEDVVYFYRVRAVNETGPSPWISGSQATLLLLPREPDQLQGIANNVCSIELTWRDRSTNEESFEVQRSALPTSGFVSLEVLPPDTESYTDITTENNTSYFYRIAANNTSGTSYSNVALVTISAALDGGLILADQDICPEGDPEPILNDVSPSGGSNSWTYQWQSRAIPGVFEDILGATGITYDPPAGALVTTEYQRISTVECGSAASNAVLITVEDVESPQIVFCPLDQLIEVERNELTSTILTENPVFTDNCEITSLTWTMTGAMTGASPDIGINYLGLAEFPVGATTITYVATDLVGNSEICEFIIELAVKAPEVLNVSIPDAFMKIGDVISASIEVADDGDTEYILLSGDIGGYPLVNFVRINSTTYLANFLIVEGGNSYRALDDIPVGNLVVSDGLIPSLPYITPISQDNDLLDAVLPVVVSADLVEGSYKIGDEVVINIRCDGISYMLDPGSTVNGVSVSEPNMRFVEIALGYYQLIYTVLEGDADIAQGEFEASLIFEKPSGNLGDAYTNIGNVDDVEIDANAPVVARLEVPDEEVGVGGFVVVTVTADGEGYTASSGTVINSIPLSSNQLEFEEVSNGLYTLTYEVSSNDNVVDPGDLEISLILSDPAENIGDAFEKIEDNELEVYTQLPLTHMVTLPEICDGEEAEIIIYLIGREPFTIELFDGENTELIEDIDTSTYSVMVSPLETTTYSIPLITDKNGVENSGTGSVTISVNESTPVKITNLQSGYSVESPPFMLTADTPGGRFSGPGVNSLTSMFSPADADTVNSPHTLYYTYESPTGCTSMDSALVFVLGAEGDIHIPNSQVCDSNDPFVATASNIAGEIGSFTLINAQENEVAGLVDNGDNTATIDPALLAGGIYTIEYAYFDAVMLYIREDFELIYVVQPEIISPSDVTSYCQNEGVVQLLANDPEAKFFGDGVTWNNTDGYTFDPAEAPTGEITITCVIYGIAGCEKQTELDLTINSASEARFTVNNTCLGEGGGMISFNNLSSSKLDVETWAWDFGDPLSGADNYSGEIDPEHFYPYPGDWSISLSATTFDACVSTYKVDTVFSSSPNSDFTWISDCFLEDQGVKFINLTEVGLTPLESMKWIFMDESGGLIEEVISDADTLEYQFASAANYLVGLQTNNEGACSDTLTKLVELRPTIKLDTEGYKEAFDITEGGWTIESADENASWVWGTPDFDGYTQDEAGNSWFTQLPEYGASYVENSWVQSPCFDFSEMNRPMIKLDVMKSFVPNVNGAVLQYMDKREEGWKTIGASSNGINWYNAYNLYNQPGGSPVGWGLDVFNPDKDWVETAHDLSSLKDKPYASLRLAIATNGAQGIGNQGFAFDNLMISEKTKLAVLEYFTNSADENSFYTNIYMKEYASENRSEVIDIQYHTDRPGDDPMNQNNPEMVSTRAGNLGVGLVPYAVLDGGVQSDYRYNFSTEENSPGSEELDLLSLSIPAFDIDLEVDWTDSDLTANTTVTCSAESYSEYVQLFVVVMESMVTAYQGTYGDTAFRNVALDILPHPGGKLLGQNWFQGVSMSLDNQWTYASYVEDVDDLMVVAFVQDRNTREILQAAVNYKTTPTGIGDRYNELRELQVYPNPVKDHLYVNLGGLSEKAGVLEVYDLSGKMLINHKTQPGYQVFNLDVQDLTRGMYLIRRFEAGELLGVGKFIKTE